MDHDFQFPWAPRGAFLDPGRWLTLVGSSYTEAEVKPGIYWGKNVVHGGVDTGAKKLRGWEDGTVMDGWCFTGRFWVIFGGLGVAI